MFMEVKSINTFYGNLHAIWDIDLYVDTGDIVALIGSNGAGKSTLLKSISGSIPIRSGSIHYNGKNLNEIHHIKANKLVKLGIVLCPEGRHIFPRLSVWENIRIGGYTRSRTEINESFERVYDLFPLLKERKEQQAGTLSGGEQQMLAIGRALMSNPKLLLLDEPSLGLSPIMTEKIFELIEKIRQQGTTILLVEQNAVMALSIANRGYVLNTGRITKTGSGSELLNSAEIMESYLGSSKH